MPEDEEHSDAIALAYCNTLQYVAILIKRWKDIAQADRSLEEQDKWNIRRA